MTLLNTTISTLHDRHHQPHHAQQQRVRQQQPTMITGAAITIHRHGHGHGDKDNLMTVKQAFWQIRASAIRKINRADAPASLQAPHPPTSQGADSSCFF